MADEKALGLGTAIARATARMGFRQCAGCKRRQALLDKHVPQVWGGRAKSSGPKAAQRRRSWGSSPKR